MNGFLLWRLALRDLRGSVTRFWVFIACLALGVATIGGVGSLSASLASGMQTNAVSLLGGDVEIGAYSADLTADQVVEITQGAERYSKVRRMRAMAEAGTERTLVELKGVDGAYPLFGQMQLSNGQDLHQALAKQGKAYGAVADAELLRRLKIQVGDTIQMAGVTLVLKALINHEPDRVANAFSLGPRLMISAEAFDATGLVQVGSLIRFRYRLDLPAGLSAGQFIQDLEARYPETGWRLRSADRAQPGVKRFLERLEVFLTLVGLTALTIGGIGVGNGVKSYLDTKTSTIATFKCLGATGGQIFRIYLLQVLLIALGAMGLGLLFSGLVPTLVQLLAGSQLPVSVEGGFYPAALGQAALYGMLVAMVFAIWPLARAREVAAAGLFRDIVAPTGTLPRPGYIVLTLALGGVLIALAIFGSALPNVAAWFTVGAIGALVAFRLLASGLMAVVRRLPHVLRPALRLALANLVRPSSGTVGVMVSLGIGLTVLSTVGLIEANISRQVADELPQNAPAFYFIDIQKNQSTAFDETVGAIAGVDEVGRVPMLRGRVARVNGTLTRQVPVAKEGEWVTRSEIGLTYAAKQPANAELTKGTWWQDDYQGPPLISLDERIATAFGIDIGDKLTFGILGREVTAEIYNLRRINWLDFGLQFVVIFAPGTLENAPQNHVAAAVMDPSVEDRVFDRVSAVFPNVTIIKVRDVMETVKKVVAQVAAAIRSMAAVTLMAGVLVLAGAIAAGHKRRTYDAVVLKVLGATRGQLLRSYGIEYLLLGLLCGGLAVVLGSLASWAVVTLVLKAVWQFDAVAAFVAIVTGIGLALTLGAFGTLRTLGQKPMSLLRSE